MTLDRLETLFRDAINAVPGATPGRFALFVSPELYVAYDGHMQRQSGGTVAFPLMFGAYAIVENMEARMGTACLKRRAEIKRAKRVR